MNRLFNNRTVHGAFGALAMLTGLNLFPGFGMTAMAQTATTSAPLSAPTTTPPPTLTVSVAHEVPTGFTARDLPLNAQRTQVNVTNNTNTTLFNLPFVLKFAAKPDTIYYVRDQSGSVGIIDGTSSVWFHTIDEISPREQLSFTVTWNKVCPGRWMLGARVGETISSPILQWIGPSPANGACPADETASPQTASMIVQNLAWPASFPLPPASSTSVAPTSTTTTAAPTTGSTKAPGGSGGTPSGTSTTSTTTSPVSAAPAAPAPPVVTSTTRPATPTTVLICQTVNGVRVCTRKGTRVVVPSSSSIPKAISSSVRTTPKSRRRNQHNKRTYQFIMKGSSSR